MRSHNPGQESEIRTLQKAIHQNAINKGLFDEGESAPETLCKIHAEVSEALKAYRMGDSAGFSEELADIVMITFSMAEDYQIDLHEEIKNKHRKNLGRPYRHGK